MSSPTPSTLLPVRNRPKSFTVFAAAFIAGAAAAVGVNRVLDVHLAQRKPQVECEPIFVALRTLPQGSPVTVWDVALKDWPKAMLPAAALRAKDSFEGYVLRHAVREGQPLLALQLVRSDAMGAGAATVMSGEAFTSPVPAAAAATPVSSTQNDLWTPAAPSEPQLAGAEHGIVATAPVADPPAPTTTDIVATTTDIVATTTDIVATDASVAVRSDMGSAPAEPTPEMPEATAPQLAEQVAPHGMPAAAIAEQAVAPTNLVAPSPEASGVPVPVTQRPTPVSTNTPEMNEAVVTDIASMPSVMAPAGKAVEAADRPNMSGSTRYLVVPERIAMQADTSFATPQPQPPGPPAISRPAAEASRQQRAAQPTGNAANSAGRRSPQQRPSQPRVQQQQQPRVQQQPRGQQQQPQQSKPAVAAPERTWNRMFPSVAAGIDAMSSPWQKSRSGSNQPSNGTPPPARR